MKLKLPGIEYMIDRQLLLKFEQKQKFGSQKSAGESCPMRFNLRLAVDPRWKPPY